MAAEVEPDSFEQLLVYLKQSRGFDFTGYKRASLRRRIDKRMRTVDVVDYEQYVDYLEVHPAEFAALFNTILINVTGFFRDAPTWTYLREEVLPRQVEALPHDHPIRVWSAGCASGQEAYSLAIVLAEILGVDAFKSRVKIYGTDIDEEALQIARQATYAERDLEPLPPEYREKYFEDGSSKRTFRSDLRRCVIFGRIDMLHDAPISRLQLLSCRNTLMYLNAETQSQVLERFHFALEDGGILMLGKAETLLSHSVLFEPIDRKRRIFRKMSTAHRDVRDMERMIAPGELGQRSELALPALDAVPVPALLVDRNGFLTHANERARATFGLSVRDHGRPFQDLEVSYRPIELRGPLEQSYAEGHTVSVRAAQWMQHGELRSLDVDVIPLGGAEAPTGALIAFRDLTQQRELEDQLRHSNQELEHAYEELQSTNEELETTNEELQSTIEELETTNEELQSTNEELETMNEELQSTNEELHAVNEEVRIRGDELDQANRFQAAILTSFRGGVVVVARDRSVRLWNARAEDLWGLREDEVRGADFLTLDIGLPVAELADALEGCLEEERDAEVTLAAVTRRGKSVQCTVSIRSFADGDVTGGAIVVMETEH